MPHNIKRQNRRLFLKSASSSLLLPALPSLSALVSAGAHASPTADKSTPPKRLCFVFFGMGVALPPEDHVAYKDWSWFPHELGPDFKFNKTLESLTPYRDQMSVMTGLSHPRTRTTYAHSTGAYFLSGADPKNPAGNSISADQVYATHLGQHTRYPYMMLSTEGGVGDFREPKTMSYSSSGQPIPSIGNPRGAFNEMFGIPSGDRESIERSFGRDRSILDAVTPDLAKLNKDLGYEDKEKLEKYLTAVRSMETRLERAQEWLDIPKPNVPESQFKALDVDPINDGPTDFIDTMYELMTTAFLTDSTRMINFQKVSESPGGLAGKFPKVALGLDDHHTLSHGFNEEGGYENWAKYDQYLAERFSLFIKQMAETDDPHADGSLLDNTAILYGSGSSTVHNTRNFPLILAGGKNLGFKHGTFHGYDESTPMSNLLLTMLQQSGTPVEHFSDSTGTLSELLG